jgi:DHA2 family multidrug resistance protein
MGFLFIPINFISYVNVPRTKNNDISGLSNLARNIGGSTGTAFLTTMLARRTQTHMSYLSAHFAPSNALFQQQVRALSQVFYTHAMAPSTAFAAHIAQAFLYQQLYRQASMLAYLDVTNVLAICCFAMLPLLLLTGKIPKPSGDAPAAH